MFLYKYLKVLRVFYKRNFVKNALMVVFLLITNLTISVFLSLFNSSQMVVKVLNDSYFEHQSVNISKFASIDTNNELIKVRTYERPSLSFMNSLMTRTGRFEIRPDYTTFFNDFNVTIFDKVVTRPQFITYMHGNYGIGINEAFYHLINDEVTLDPHNLRLKLELKTTFMVDGEARTLVHNDEVFINFIYEEPSYFSSPKIYLPENYLDVTIGSYAISEGVSLTNYLLNLNSHDELANLSLRCHFHSREQYASFVQIIDEISGAFNGYEISSDHLNKIASFTALYAYLEILIKILFVFVVIALIVILVVIAHTSLLANMRQMALLNVLGAKKGDLYVFFVFLLTFNFVLGLFSLVLLPSLLTLFNHLLYYLLRINISLTLNINHLIMVMSLNYLFLLSAITIIFMLNMRRPLLYLLLDA